MVSFTSRLLYPVEIAPVYPQNRKLGGLQHRAGRSGEEKTLFFLRGVEPRFIESIFKKKQTLSLHVIHDKYQTATCFGTGGAILREFSRTKVCNTN
jgi:hypothetical protein